MIDVSRKLSLDQWRKNEGVEDEDAFMELLGTYVYDSVCPPLCTSCDMVEPDGHCQHGHPSVLLEAGLI